MSKNRRSHRKRTSTTIRSIKKYSTAIKNLLGDTVNGVASPRKSRGDRQKDIAIVRSLLGYAVLFLAVIVIGWFMIGIIGGK